MIITIREVNEELKDDGSPKYIEWLAAGADGKEIKLKLYPAIQVNEEWIHFEDRWEEFLNAKDKTYDIERASIKLERGYWKPVIEAKEVKDILVKEAQKKVEEKSVDTRDKSMAISYAKDLVVADKIPITELITQADKIYTYITGGDDEALQIHKEIAKEVGADEAGQETRGEPIDMDWLHESLQLIDWKSVVIWMKKKYEITEGKTVREIFEYMNELQKSEFVAEVKNRLAQLEELPF